MNFDQQHLSVKVALRLYNVFTGYRHHILYIITDFKSQKGSMEALIFSGNLPHNCIKVNFYRG